MCDACDNIRLKKEITKQGCCISHRNCIIVHQTINNNLFFNRRRNKVEPTRAVVRDYDEVSTVATEGGVRAVSRRCQGGVRVCQGGRKW
jgi:hypothetical protein